MTIEWLSGEFDQVRWAIDASLTEDTLPMAPITSPVHGGAATDAIEGRLTTPFASLSAEDQARVRRARVLLTAAYLCPAVPNITSERSADGYQYARQAVDWKARAAELASRADEEIAALAEPTNATPARPSFFGVASGRRGW